MKEFRESALDFGRVLVLLALYLAVVFFIAASWPATTGLYDPGDCDPRYGTC